MSPDDPFFADALRIEATALARRRGVDSNRAIRVFERLANVGWLAPNFPWNTAVDEAAAFVGIERALSLFEQEDTLELAHHVGAVDFLTQDNLAPVFTIYELAQHLRKSITHLEANQEPWLKIGYPGIRMPIHPWLALRLECLLPVKEAQIDAGAEIPTYRWLAEPPDPPLQIPVAEGGHLYFPVGRILLGEAATFVEYGDAPVFACLTDADADRAVALRAPLLNARRAVLGTLLNAVESGHPDLVWPTVLSALTDHLAASEVDFLLETEATLKEWDPAAEVEHRHGFRSFVAYRGGLSDLFELAGACEVALRLHRYSDVLAAFAEHLGNDPISSYYEVIGRPCRTGFDEALNRFIALEADERASWVEFKDRVNRAIAEEFSEPITITVRVKRPYVEHFEPMVRTFAEWQKEHLEHGGPPLAITSPSQVAGTERRSGDSAFPPPLHLSCERDGERHEVLVDGLPVLLTDQQLALLLRLIRARLTDGDGWLDLERADGGGLIAEGFLSDADRAINRFRSEFKTACRPHDPKQLFPRAQGKLRLATAPEFVTWNPDALLAIDNAIVAKEALAIIAST